MQEFKGDKFAIGGGKYKNQTHFTTYKINYQQNDGIFFFSDGYPDQFGGENNRKFSPRKIRNLILEHFDGVSMQELRKEFDQAFMEWKGETKQTDDVLMIGIRF